MDRSGLGSSANKHSLDFRLVSCISIIRQSSYRPTLSEDSVSDTGTGPMEGHHYKIVTNVHTNLLVTSLAILAGRMSGHVRRTLHWGRGGAIHCIQNKNILLIGRAHGDASDGHFPSNLSSNQFRSTPSAESVAPLGTALTSVSYTHLTLPTKA